jgi:hypothetical protein
VGHQARRGDSDRVLACFQLERANRFPNQVAEEEAAGRRLQNPPRLTCAVDFQDQRTLVAASVSKVQIVGPWTLDRHCPLGHAVAPMTDHQPVPLLFDGNQILRLVGQLTRGYHDCVGRQRHRLHQHKPGESGKTN